MLTIYSLMISWAWQNVTNEGLRTIAALFQAVGIFSVGGGAFSAYMFNRQLEKDKFKLKLKEIIHANTEKRKLEVLEEISKLTGEAIFRMWYVGNVIDTINKPIVKREGESREDWISRRFRVRIKQLNKVLIQLHHVENAGSIYLTPDLLGRILDWRAKINGILDSYINKMTMPSPISGDFFPEFRKGWEYVRKDREEIVKVIRTLISY